MTGSRDGRRAGRPILAATPFIVGGILIVVIGAAIAGIWIGGSYTAGSGAGAVTDRPAAGTGAQATLGTDADEPPPPPIRVEVLNGSGVGGLAREATYRLRGGGFDVVYYGNASRFDHRRSVVLDRTGDTLQARTVALALGIDSVASSADARLLLDVTVVLGSDWPPPAPEPFAPAGWLRRLLAPGDSGP